MNETLKIATESKEKHHECNCLTKDKIAELQQQKNDLQWEYDKLKSKEYYQSYTIENQKKRIEDLGKTLKLYEKENKAFRELIALWI